MSTDQSGREPRYSDYLREAFNVRLKVKGLGGVPINWLYLAGVGVVSIALWPVALVGAAGELAFLTTLSNSGRFQRAVRARLKQRSRRQVEAQLDAMVTGLPENSRMRYEAFRNQCEEILQIARGMSRIADAAIDTYAVHLAELREIYARMVILLHMFSTHSRDWERTDPEPEIKRLEKELTRADMSESVRKSHEATLELLRKRAESRRNIVERANTIRAEINRLEQQVALFRDQALLTRDPAVLSDNMDTAAGILGEHTAWLQENAALLQEIDDASA